MKKTQRLPLMEDTSSMASDYASISLTLTKFPPIFRPYSSKMVKKKYLKNLYDHDILKSQDVNIISAGRFWESKLNSK